MRFLASHMHTALGNYGQCHFVPCCPNPKSPPAHSSADVVVVEVLHDVIDKNVDLRKVL